MATKRDSARLVVMVVAAALTQALVASPVLAQAEPDCVCIVAGGTSGLVTDASADAPLSVGSVLRTGVAGSATATFGDGCSVNVAALSEMSIAALQDGRMCVRLQQDAAGAAEGEGTTGAALAAGGAILATTVVVVGLGQDEPVSK